MACLSLRLAAMPTRALLSSTFTLFYDNHHSTAMSLSATFFRNFDEDGAIVVS